MIRPRNFIGIIALLAGAAALFVGLREAPAARRLIDLTLADLRLKVLPDRSVAIEASLRNPGASRTRPSTVTFVVDGAPHVETIGPLDPGAGLEVAWRSPPLGRGHHEVEARVAAHPGELDRDESDNQIREFVDVAGDGATARARAMPAVVGLDRKPALRRLGRAGFREIRWVTPVSGEATERIVQQWPAPGSRLERGARPILVAEALVAVPRLEGLTLGGAKELLERAGLHAGPLRIRTAKDGAGGVRAQNPPPGTRVRIDSGIALEMAEPAWKGWPVAGGGALSLVLGALMSRRPASRRRRSSAPRRALAAPRVASLPVPAPLPALAGSSIAVSAPLSGPVESAWVLVTPAATGSEAHASARVDEIAARAYAWEEIFPTVPATAPPMSPGPYACAAMEDGAWAGLENAGRRDDQLMAVAPAADADVDVAIAAVPEAEEDAMPLGPPEDEDDDDGAIDCVPRADLGNQSITWHPDTASPLIVLLPVHDAGRTEVDWRRSLRSAS